ncbi:hypothetical protein L395_06840 [Klebsiella pneumoniae BWH 2]|nr:hypothetical protein L395_06840 [Klebsiella pneumoniae BWH 2]
MQTYSASQDNSSEPSPCCPSSTGGFRYCRWFCLWAGSGRSSVPSRVRPGVSVIVWGGVGAYCGCVCAVSCQRWLFFVFGWVGGGVVVGLFCGGAVGALSVGLFLLSAFEVVVWMRDGWPLYEPRLKGELHVIRTGCTLVVSCGAVAVRAVVVVVLKIGGSGCSSRLFLFGGSILSVSWRAYPGWGFGSGASGCLSWRQDAVDAGIAGRAGVVVFSELA